jgi:cell division protein FtsB
MRLSAAIQRNVVQVIGPLVGAFLVAYFGYYALHGDRGLIALAQLQTQIEQSSATLERLKAERVVLERRVKGLRPDSLDLDILEERTRALLNYAHPDDLIILNTPKN